MHEFGQMPLFYKLIFIFLQPLVIYSRYYPNLLYSLRAGCWICAYIIALRDYTVPRVLYCKVSVHSSDLALPPPPAPSPPSECVPVCPPPPPEPKRGQHSLAGEGEGVANSDDWREGLAPLCGVY